MALNLSKKDIEEKIKNQIALEVNCLPEDFDKNENMITTACQSEKRRKFSDKPFFLQMATFGKSTVISADDSIHPWLTEWVKGKQGIWLFEQQESGFLNSIIIMSLNASLESTAIKWH